MSDQRTNSTKQRYNTVILHDSKLVGLCFYKGAGEDGIG